MATKEEKAEIISYQLKALAHPVEELTDGEVSILVSYEYQFGYKGTLSPRQMEVLEEIYMRRT
jgi:hypothetical protein